LIELVVREMDCDLLLVGGEAEGERLQRLAAALPLGRGRVAQNMPLPGLAKLLANATAFIGHDSGISHLAAAVGLPGLVLWSETAEEIWRPPSEKVQIVRHPSGLDQLSPQEALTRLRLVL
jgi:heptosyltransferase-3